MTSDSSSIPPLSGPSNYFLDGALAHRLSATVSVSPDTVRYTLTSGQSAVWRFEELDWTLGEIEARQIRLSKGGDPEQWLVLVSIQDVREFKLRYNAWERSRGARIGKETKALLRASAGTVILIVLAWLAWPVVTDLITPLVPDEVDEKLEKSAYEDIAHHFRICAGRSGASALTTIRDRLAANDPTLRAVKIHVVEMPVPNAFTLPGGQVLVTRELIDQASSGDEVAGVLAHEFGHVLHKDSIRSVLRRGLPALILHVFGVDGLESAAGAADFFINSAFRRSDEAAADKTGLDLMKAAGISPKGFMDFFARLEKEQSESGILDFVSDHPPPADRLAMISAVTVTNSKPVLDAAEWQALRDICSGEL
jgi:Zn-dependent protease with chaperone function